MKYAEDVSTSPSVKGNLAVKGQKVSPADRRRVIASFFRDHRIANGLSQEQVASCVGGVDAAQVEAFESAIDPIPLDMIFALTNALNIPPEDVMSLIYDVYNENDC